MAVYERAYRGYSGPLTPAWSRFLIIPRYVYRQVFGSKLFTVFFTACFVPPVGFAVLIYLNHNLSALAALDIPEGALRAIIPKLFGSFVAGQSFLAFLLALLVGPALVSPDLANNGLALYLCRPFSRTEYVAGKMAVLVFLLSVITWVPGIVLFALQSGLQGGGWMGEHMRIAGTIVFGFALWILVLSLLTLAASAWVKRKFLAGALVFGVFFVSAAFGAAINATFRTHYGFLIDLGGLISTVFARLFGGDAPTPLSLGSAVTSLLIFCGLCLLLLARKVRAYEVAR